MSTTRTACPACGSILVPGAPFCGACGASSRGIAPLPTLPSPAPLAPVTQGTPDATGADPAPAILPRVLALVVDQAVAGLAAGLVFAIVLVAADTTAALRLPGLVVAAVQVGQWIWEGRTGKTVGNLAFHLRTVSAATGRPAGFGTIFVRQLIQSCGALACFVGVYVVAASGAWDSSGRRQGWHDKVAGTLVVAGLPASVVEQGAREAVPTPDPTEVGIAAPSPLPTLQQPRSQARPTPDLQPASAALRAPELWSAPTGIISAVPGFAAVAPAAPQPVPARTQVPPQTPTARTQVPAPQPPMPRPASPLAPVVVDELDDLDETRLSSAPVAGLSEFVLSFDTGEVVHVAGDGVVGRNPAPAAGETVEHRVCIPDHERSVSKTHLGFGLDLGGLWVADLGSTNGSALIGADGVRTTLEAGVRAHVTSGAVVQIGDHNFRVATS
ncbi:MAG: RDD family protein [Cellulomonas sp.]